MKALYRNYTPSDIDQLVEFWNNNSGWDIIDRPEWERRFYHTPLGKASVMLALDKKSHEILGQFVFIPSVVNVDGKEIQAFRPFAPIVKTSLRSALGLLTLFEIVMKMYNHSVDHFKINGVGLIHMLPDPRWLRGFQLLPGVQIDYFPLWSLPLPLKKKFAIPENYEIVTVNPTDERINALWKKNSMLYGCSVVRNTKILPWKTSHGCYQLLGLVNNGELVGMSASIAKPKDKQWLVCDILTANGDEALTLIIKATCNQAQEYLVRAQQNEPLVKVAVLATPLIQKAITPLGFEKDNYRFPMVVQLLDSALTKKQVAPQRWYASAND